MPIPRNSVTIALVRATPTPMSVDGLKAQLTAIGLTCPDSESALLPGYIADVQAQLPAGQVQSYGILEPVVPSQTLVGHRLSFHEMSALALVAGGTSQSTATLADAATGNWTIDPSGDGYSTKLEYIQFESHFEWLKANRSSFTGINDDPPAYTGRFDSIDAIKQLFIKTGTAASATLIKGLDPDAVQAMLSNVIAPLDDTNSKNYAPGPASRVLFLVDNYNPATREADGIGVLTIWWNLTISDYKAKKQNPQHETSLTVKSWSVLYDSIEAMNADFAAAKAQFNPAASVQPAPARPSLLAGAAFGLPPGPGKVTIFDALPAANATTFSQALPTLATSGRLSAIVLYAPDLDNIGSIDNTTSKATTTYTKSVTTGFTFSTTQTLSVSSSIEVSILVVKASVTVGFSISFTEQWSTTNTTTMAFSVPPGEKAFTYQGYLLAAVIYYDPSKDSYSYGPTARFVTEILTTSATPLTGVSTFKQVAVESVDLSSPREQVPV